MHFANGYLKNKVRREIAALLRLVPLVCLAMLAAVLLWRSDLAASAGLFQSPPPADSSESPLQTPTPLPPTSTPVRTVPPAPLSTATPVSVAPTAAAPTAEVVLPLTVPTQLPATATALPATPTQILLPTARPLPTRTALPAVIRSEATADEPTERYANGASNLKFEWGMLFDSVALGVSYIWLCCGGLVLFGVLGLFLALWVANKRRQQGEE